jgi:Phage derived protein Gp49-like (DUF891)
MQVKVVRAQRWRVLALCDSRGACELLEFLASVGSRFVKDRTRLLALFDRIAEQGPPRNDALSHHLSGDVWEFIQGGLRVLWFYDAGRVVICSHALVKKARKIPLADIRKAQAGRDAFKQAQRLGRVEVVDDEEEEDV